MIETTLHRLQPVRPLRERIQFSFGGVADTTDHVIGRDRVPRRCSTPGSVGV